MLDKNQDPSWRRDDKELHTQKFKRFVEKGLQSEAISFMFPLISSSDLVYEVINLLTLLAHLLNHPMDTASINKQLQAVYESYLATLHQPGKIWDENMSSPLLMHVFDEYENVSKKIMFVGQETHSWAGFMNERRGLSELLKEYESFQMGNTYKGSNGSSKPRPLNSPFWNFNRSCFVGINGLKNDRRNKGFLWTNISKFDVNGTTPSKEHVDAHIQGFELLIQEINITQPDIVVFYTGKKYRDYLNEKLNLEESKWRQLGDEVVPLKTIDCEIGNHQCRLFRTEHPRTLCQGKEYRGKGMYRIVLNKLIEEASTGNS
ncbi:MAG: hypothetical protein EOO39_18930 [Cytophagaceae bacterium]|nr:MAG: hypothetical protein EOO39_18930 [Cytophagaceae bacterium]